MSNVLERQLDRETSLRSEVNSTCWTVFSIFVAAMAVLVDALAQTTSERMRIAISVAGVLASGLWTALQWRCLAHLEMHDQIMEGLERELEKDPLTTIPKEFSSTFRNREAYEKIREHAPFQARDVMRRGTLVSLLAWLGAASWYIAHR